VLDPGAEPREVLRQRPQLRVPEWVDVTLKLRTSGDFTSTTLETTHSDIDYPSIKAHQRLEASSHAPNGATTIKLAIDDVRVLDDVVDRNVKPLVTKRVKNLRGTTSSWRLEPDGHVTGFTSDLSDLPPGVLHSMVVPASFPSTAVGVGARWQATEPITVGGIRFEQTRNYRLVALDADSATVAIDFVARAASQPLSVEPNATVRLKSGSMTLTGTSKIPLRGIAWSGEGRGLFETDLLIVQGHRRTSSRVRLETLTISQPAQK
jgi:hypothetical protein